MISLRSWKSQNDRFAGPQEQTEFDKWMLQRHEEAEKERKRLDESVRRPHVHKTILKRNGEVICSGLKRQ